ncbi:MAG: hypothetical protein NZ744_13300, partial [Pirellulaceae bacterium]|nr:hypothetical protein [Pirellulaceae bacterium]
DTKNCHHRRGLHHEILSLETPNSPQNTTFKICPPPTDGKQPNENTKQLISLVLRETALAKATQASTHKLHACDTIH